MNESGNGRVDRPRVRCGHYADCSECPVLACRPLLLSCYGYAATSRRSAPWPVLGTAIVSNCIEAGPRDRRCIFAGTVPPNWWQWGCVTVSRSTMRCRFRSAACGNTNRRLGFGAMIEPNVHGDALDVRDAEAQTILISGAAVATLRGSGVIVPYWFLVLATMWIARLDDRALTRSLLICIAACTLVADRCLTRYRSLAISVISRPAGRVTDHARRCEC